MDEGRPIAAAVSLLEEVVPLDDRRLLEGARPGGLHCAAGHDTEIAGSAATQTSGSRNCAAVRSRSSAKPVVLHPDRDMDVETERAHALVDGLTVHLLLDPTEIAPAVSGRSW